jgi:hypothetical protein
MNIPFLNPLLLLITLVSILAIFLLGKAAARHPEGVMNAVAVLGVAILLGGLGFTVLNAGAAGALIIGVQAAGFAVMILMLWRHWNHRADMRR